MRVFPILLLGGQFLTLFAVSLASHVPLEWIGFGCVLVAIPVLIAADALTDVFQKQNGPLARLLPWRIILPIFIGLSMTVTGIALTAIRFPDVVALGHAAKTGCRSPSTV